MTKKSCFVDLLKKKGYNVTKRKLGGGFVNDVNLITASKGGQIFEYVLKKYGSEKDVKDMLRGYKEISSIVKTPTIVYHKGKEVVYDLVKGKSIKDMIIEHDPKASEAIKLLGRELEKLHNSKNAPPRYKKGDSPDERKMIKHIARALQNETISRKEANNLVRSIRKYIPKNKAIIHGDAHLGNFIYSNGEVYFIDPDNVKISDYNADIGKVVYAIERLGDEKRISSRQCSKLKELFLDEYDGEDLCAVNIYRARTPLIELKSRILDFARRGVRKASSLEARVSSAVVLAILSFIFLNNQNNFTGFIIDNVKSGNLLIGLFLIIVGFVAYILIKRKN